MKWVFAAECRADRRLRKRPFSKRIRVRMQVHKKMQKLIPWRATFLKRRIQIIKYRF